MKKLLILSVLMITISMAGFSCKLVTFTTTLQEKFNLSKEDLKQVQFYVSEDVVLTKELSGKKSDIVNGKIKTFNNKRVDEITICAKTPCLVIDTNSKGNLKVSFSESNEKTLTFGNMPNSSKFVLLAEKWEGRTGTVNYGGEKYQVGGFGYDASLCVKMKDLRKVRKNRHRERGRKL
jgi:hypothetical protein